jgi:hypothetical protein
VISPTICAEIGDPFPKRSNLAIPASTAPLSEKVSGTAT